VRLTCKVLLVVGALVGLVDAAMAQDTPKIDRVANALLYCQNGQTTFNVFVRQDLSDISLFDCPTPDTLRTAVGTRVSFTFDEIAHTDSLSIDGVVGGILRIYGDGLPFVGLAAGPYVQGNESYTFSSSGTSNSTSNSFAGGGFVQVGFNDFAGLGTNFFRLRAAETAGSSNVGTNTVVGEWLPVYDALHTGTSWTIPGTAIGYVFAPELMVQYDQLIYGPRHYLLFSESTEAIRVGPQVVLKLFVFKENMGDPVLRSLLAPLTMSVTYHSSWDARTGANYYWVAPTINYALGDSGNYAISAGYGYGNSETTGNLTSQYKVGFAMKF
jgi:hypothetical protein